MFQNYFKAFRVSSMDCRSNQVFDNLVFFLLTANETEAFIFLWNEVKSNMVIETKDIKLDEYIESCACLQWLVFGLADYRYYTYFFVHWL